jgi:hypothetical protein
MPSEAFQLSPSAARARFDELQARRETDPDADDPLFRPIDADDFRVNGDNASDFSNLVENGLVRVTMPLPLNVKLTDPETGEPSDETSVDLWRAVMPVLNVAISGPDGVLPMWPPAPRVPILGQLRFDVLPRSRSRAERARNTREGGLQPRLRSMPRRHVASKHIHSGRHPRASTRALSQHSDRVSAPGAGRLLALSGED